MFTSSHQFWGIAYLETNKALRSILGKLKPWVFACFSRQKVTKLRGLDKIGHAKFRLRKIAAGPTEIKYKFLLNAIQE